MHLIAILPAVVLSFGGTILGLLVTPSFFTIVDDIEHFVAVAKARVMGLVQRGVPSKA